MHTAGIYLTAATSAYAAALLIIAFVVLTSGLHHTWAAVPPLALLLTFGPQRNWLVAKDNAQTGIDRLRQAIRIATTTTIWTFLIVPIPAALVAHVIPENPETITNLGAGDEAIIAIYLHIVDFGSNTNPLIILSYFVMYTIAWFRTGSLSRKAEHHSTKTTTA